MSPLIGFSTNICLRQEQRKKHPLPHPKSGQLVVALQCNVIQERLDFCF